LRQGGSLSCNWDLRSAYMKLEHECGQMLDPLFDLNVNYPRGLLHTPPSRSHSRRKALRL
jgi:hypothetical protein